VRPLLGARPRERENLTIKLTVVAQLRLSVALEGTHVDAELLDHLELRGDTSANDGACGGLIGEPLCHAGNRIQRLGGERLRRDGPQIRGTVADSERLKSGALPQKSHHGEELRRSGLGQKHGTCRISAQVPALLAAVVVDLQVPGALAAHLEHVPLPQGGQLDRIGPRCGTQRSVILDDDGERRGQSQYHGARSAGEPMRFEPMNCPLAGVGAMMTWTLSDSLSASVF